MNKKRIVITVGVLVVLVTGVAQFLFPRTALSPQIPTAFEPFEPLLAEQNSATTLNIKEVVVSSPIRPAPKLPAIAKGDTIASWSFKGAYADRPELVTKAEAEIKRLHDFIGKGTYPDVSLYVGIANQYALLGDGKLEYEYLSQAIMAGGAATGLPWHNLGVLMERLGALESARVAYETSTLIQPEFKFYHYAYFEFLTTRMRDDTADIEKEFAAAIKNLGQDTDILSLYAEWKQS